MSLMIEPAFLQILGLGLIWVSFHCGPMCGPIVQGLRLSEGGKWAWQRGILFYQFGRALPFAFFGGLAGALGSSESFGFSRFGFVVILFLSLMLIFKLGWIRLNPQISGWSSFLTRQLSRLQKIKVGKRRSFLLGLLFSLLPCMLVAWALSVAATTQSIWKGSVCMLLLLTLTSLPLGFVVWGSQKFWRLFGKKSEVFSLSISLVWTSLMWAAARGWIEHFHYRFEILDEPLTLMFW